jgi:hypothetical protein
MSLRVPSPRPRSAQPQPWLRSSGVSDDVLPDSGRHHRLRTSQAVQRCAACRDAACSGAGGRRGLGRARTALSGRGDRRCRLCACAVVEFLMHDKNYNGSIDLDECVQLLYARFGKVRRVLASRPVPFAPHPATTHHVPSASRLSPPASRLPPPCLPTPRAVRAPAPAALLQEVVDKRVREMFGQSDTEKNISFSKCATAAPPPRPAAPSPRPAAPSPRPAAPRRAPPRPAAPRRAPPRHRRAPPRPAAPSPRPAAPRRAPPRPAGTCAPPPPRWNAP